MMRVRSFLFSAVFGLAVLAIALPVRGVLGEIVSTNIYLLVAGDVQEEDVYVAANSSPAMCLCSPTGRWK